MAPDVKAGSRWLYTTIALAAVAAACLWLGGSETHAPLSEDQVTTLASLKRLSSHPLYAMAYTGPYETTLPSGTLSECEGSEPWACSLFAALGGSAPLYGRNFDWEDCPALLLFTKPPGGYASVSLVDIAFLFPGESSTLADLGESALVDRVPLLTAPAIPFDGMNERGLVVGMAAVPSASPPYDPAKPRIHSVGVIREMLDHAATVEEALDVLDQFNVEMIGGPPIHYLVADRLGQAALVELYGGERVVLTNVGPWHAATNFLMGPLGAHTAHRCWRYDRLTSRLLAAEGVLTARDAMALLLSVSQPSTQWSAVYDIAGGTVRVAMGRDDQTTFAFTVSGEELPRP